ncbi:hypothetical protein FB45DRAFT_361810 [Roridomyces roridus]|uniref:Uncharacterized protein n=1 Tax=Roridomyces roridus TaxID=1738132 RepID=A0AAD7C8K8_9AGAR|nr:hypothetical protein FB45DRAFT_361810 [Roridomyces roridus]
MYLKLLEALAINPSPSLTSLELVNIMAIPDSLYSREDLFAIFRPLKKLEIAAIRGDCRDASLEGESDGTFEVEGTYTDPQLVAEFWDTIVPSVVRRATALTSLTLRTNQWIGGHPAMSFKDIFLPQLSELVLQKFHLEPVDPDYDIVQFVIRHKATLTRLDLRHCAIGCWYNDQGWRSWHAVFTTFAMELGKLTEFVFLAFTDDEEEDEFGEQGARFLYSHSLGSADYEIAELDEDVVEGDRPAFEHLQRLVLARKSPGS